MDLTELLKCPVCTGMVNEPKQLPCQHSLCWRPCLERLLQRSRSCVLKCPVCEADHAFSQINANTFPNSFLLKNLLDLYKNHHDTVSSVRNATQVLSRDGHNGSGQGMSSAETPDSFKKQKCEECRSIGQKREICLHCAKKICQQCHLKHIRLVRTAVHDYYHSILLIMSELKEKQDESRHRIDNNPNIAQLFQTFQQMEHDMTGYVEWVRSMNDDNDENNLIFLLFQSEAHMQALAELRMHPVLYRDDQLSINREDRAAGFIRQNGAWIGLFGAVLIFAHLVFKAN
ncbi:RING finger protein nhl-1-like [Ruditapes philippinarum]|uniref:RING finger protein nhl-1-like n=1 Tax=Ruditapes philippinarum TaxID=129788 RepID=UPI00295B3373|nr:RING finger protein nhl-1-like [Ruditapes philippinarum]